MDGAVISTAAMSRIPACEYPSSEKVFCAASRIFALLLMALRGLGFAGYKLSSGNLEEY
jgi:hypothetical protein